MLRSPFKVPSGLRLGVALLAWLCMPGLSQADITTSLALYWPMDAGSGTTIADSAGSTTGTFKSAPGAPTWQTAGNCRVGASCLAFDGSDDGATLSYTLPAATYTWAAWVYSTTTSGNAYGTLMSNPAGGAGGVYLVQQNGANVGKIDFYYSNADHFSTGTVTLNTWTHVAVVQNAGAVTFYLNGVPSGTASSGTGGYALTQLGWDGTSSGFAGRLDDLRIYTRALSVGDILELVTGQASGPRRVMVY